MKRNVQSNNEKNIDFAFELMRQKLGLQLDAHGSLENKIGILLGFVGVMAGSSIILIKQSPALFGLNIFTIGLFGLYIALLLLVIASQTRRYLDPPDFPAFYSESALKMTNIDLKNQVIADMKKSYKINNKHHEEKAKLYDYAISIFVVSILFLFLGILEKQL